MKSTSRMGIVVLLALKAGPHQTHCARKPGSAFCPDNASRHLRREYVLSRGDREWHHPGTACRIFCPSVTPWESERSSHHARGCALLAWRREFPGPHNGLVYHDV